MTIPNFLSAIRNGQQQKKEAICVNSSKHLVQLSSILLQEGFLTSFYEESGDSSLEPKSKSESKGRKSRSTSTSTSTLSSKKKLWVGLKNSNLLKASGAQAPVIEKLNILSSSGQSRFANKFDLRNSKLIVPKRRRVKAEAFSLKSKFLPYLGWTWVRGGQKNQSLGNNDISEYLIRASHSQGQKQHALEDTLKRIQKVFTFENSKTFTFSELEVEGKIDLEADFELDLDSECGYKVAAIRNEVSPSPSTHAHLHPPLAKREKLIVTGLPQGRPLHFQTKPSSRSTSILPSRSKLSSNSDLKRKKYYSYSQCLKWFIHFYRVFAVMVDVKVEQEAKKGKFYDYNHPKLWHIIFDNHLKSWATLFGLLKPFQDFHNHSKANPKTSKSQFLGPKAVFIRISCLILIYTLMCITAFPRVFLVLFRAFLPLFRAFLPLFIKRVGKRGLIFILTFITAFRLHRKLLPLFIKRVGKRSLILILTSITAFRLDRKLLPLFGEFLPSFREFLPLFRKIEDKRGFTSIDIRSLYVLELLVHEYRKQKNHKTFTEVKPISLSPLSQTFREFFRVQTHSLLSSSLELEALESFAPKGALDFDFDLEGKALEGPKGRKLSRALKSNLGSKSRASGSIARIIFPYYSHPLSQLAFTNSCILRIFISMFLNRVFFFDTSKSSSQKALTSGQRLIIISTLKGLMSDREARAQNLGGKLIAIIHT